MKDRSNHRNKEVHKLSGVPVRSQTPSDAYGHDCSWEPGTMPCGGFRAVIPFNDGDCKNSPTSKPEKQNRIV